MCVQWEAVSQGAAVWEVGKDTPEAMLQAENEDAQEKGETKKPHPGNAAQSKLSAHH